MTIPQEVRLARHAGDLDDDGHDVHIPPLADDGDMLFLETLANVATVAEGASASASSTLGGYTVASVIDGNDSTVWHPGSSVSGQWAQVDLGAVRPIAGWRIVISTNANEIPTSWGLEHWDDTLGWTSADSVSGGAGGDKGYRALSAAVEARYWRILQSGTVPWDAAVYTFDLYLTGLAATPSQDYGRSLLDTVDAADARTLLGIIASALTVEEVDGSPTDSAVTKLVFPNGTLSIAAHVVTYTPTSSGTAIGGHAHVVSEAHVSNGSTTTFTLDQAFEDGSVIAWNTTTLARLGVTETQPDQATVSAAGASGDTIMFDYAATVV